MNWMIQRTVFDTQQSSVEITHRKVESNSNSNGGGDNHVKKQVKITLLSLLVFDFMPAAMVVSNSLSVSRKKQRIWDNKDVKYFFRQIKRKKRQSIASKTWLLKLQAEWKFVLLCFLRVSLCRVDHGIEMVPQWGLQNGKKVHQIMRTNKISYNFRLPKFYEIFQTPTAAVRVYFSTNMWLQECLKARIKVCLNFFLHSADVFLATQI